MGRNGQVYKVPNKLDPGDVVWERLQNTVKNYRDIDNKATQQSNVKSLFLSEFDSAMTNQKAIILGGYLTDPIVDGRWYEELEDGRFVLYRGTNRNESLHKRYVVFSNKDR